MLWAWILFADAVGDADKKAPDQPGPLGLLFPIVLMFIVFYLLIIVPGKRERQQRQSMLTMLKKNDKIVTHGGIVGVITNLKEGTEEMTIKSDETKLVVLKSAVARILTEPEKEPAKESSSQIKPA